MVCVVPEGMNKLHILSLIVEDLLDDYDNGKDYWHKNKAQMKMQI